MKPADAPVERRLPLALIAALVVIWLLLSQTWSLAQLLLGILLATVLAIVSTALRPVPRLRHLHEAGWLAVLVLGDIIRSNFAVARIVLGLTRGPEVTSAFIKVPLQLRDPYGLAVLAAIVTSTPGTVWVDFNAASQTLTIHVLDMKDEQEWIDWIKNRYERLLLRIFE
jgi:multicomponent K+:H+ antiporter subunit E